MRNLMLAAVAALIAAIMSTQTLASGRELEA